MSIFGSSTPLAGDFEAVLAESKSYVRRLVTKGQEGIRAALMPREVVSLIAVEHYTATRTIVVTDQRVLIMRKGGRKLERAASPADIGDVRMSQDGHGTCYVMIDGPGAVVKFHDAAIARLLTARISALLQGRRA